MLREFDSKVVMRELYNKVVVGNLGYNLLREESDGAVGGKTGEGKDEETGDDGDKESGEDRDEEFREGEDKESEEFRVGEDVDNSDLDYKENEIDSQLSDYQSDDHCEAENWFDEDFTNDRIGMSSLCLRIPQHMLGFNSGWVTKGNEGEDSSVGSSRVPFTPTFKRVFMDLKALKEGFLNSCSPFIGFDGCHLKGPWEGVLLATMGLDGNNGLYLIAFVVVDNEYKDSWGFFFQCLDGMLGGFNTDKPCTFMIER
ncbi:hypothetical protein Pfo_003579 [Paulownia fortunei]|nr:hypothetical protein Pfo_003579 [Paulownia fortunei]